MEDVLDPTHELFSREAVEFKFRTGASQEAMEKLQCYEKLLIEWGNKFNLIAPSTIPHIWSRHFFDSAQLLPLMPTERSIVADMGSGAGFPGLVLSIMGITGVHLIESTGKKADFLRAVISELGLDCAVHQRRVEDLDGFKADVVTARALAPLNELLPLAARILRKEGICLFLKGQKVDVELTDAKKYWMFSPEKTQSLSDPSGCVLTIRNLKNVGKTPQYSRRK